MRTPTNVAQKRTPRDIRTYCRIKHGVLWHDTAKHVKNARKKQARDAPLDEFHAVLQSKPHCQPLKGALEKPPSPRLPRPGPPFDPKAMLAGYVSQHTPPCPVCETPFGIQFPIGCINGDDCDTCMTAGRRRCHANCFCKACDA